MAEFEPAIPKCGTLAWLSYILLFHPSFTFFVFDLNRPSCVIFSFFAKLSFTQSFTSSHFQKCIVFFEPGIFPFILFCGLPRSAPAHNSAFATDRRSKVNTKF